MSAYAESTASFKHRCEEIGFSAADIQSLVDQGIRSFNNLAFAVCGQPGTIDDQVPGVACRCFHKSDVWR